MVGWLTGLGTKLYHSYSYQFVFSPFQYLYNYVVGTNFQVIVQTACSSESSRILACWTVTIVVITEYTSNLFGAEIFTS